MTEVSSCVICDEAIRKLRRARVAPFIAKRIWDRRPFSVDLVECKGCGFIFYNPRLDTDEEFRLYTNYRLDEYCRMRHAAEPWYTEKFNASLASPDFYRHRRKKLAALLAKHLGARRVASILDFGGDHGDLVCGLIGGASAFVYEISGVEPIDGVTSVSAPAECRADLIVSSNVLEHIGFPRQLVAEMVKAAPPGGLIFLEVPCETPFGMSRIARRVAQVGVVALTRPALAFSVVRPDSLYMMHEHVNYYTEKSMRALMNSCGCNLIAAGNYFLDEQRRAGELVWALATT